MATGRKAQGTSAGRHAQVPKLRLPGRVDIVFEADGESASVETDMADFFALFDAAADHPSSKGVQSRQQAAARRAAGFRKQLGELRAAHPRWGYTRLAEASLSREEHGVRKGGKAVTVTFAELASGAQKKKVRARAKYFRELDKAHAKNSGT